MPTIPDLPAVVVVSGTELLPVDDGALTSKATANELLVRQGVGLVVGNDKAAAHFGTDQGFDISSADGSGLKYDWAAGSVNIRYPAAGGFDLRPLGAGGGTVRIGDGIVEFQIQGGVMYFNGQIASSKHEPPTGLGTIIARLPLYDWSSGTLLGYVPVYDVV